MKYTGHFRILDMGDRKMKFTEGMEISLDSVDDVRILENENIYYENKNPLLMND